MYRNIVNGMKRFREYLFDAQLGCNNVGFKRSAVIVNRQYLKFMFWSNVQEIFTRLYEHLANEFYYKNYQIW